MKNLSAILSQLQAAIAVVAARDRCLTVLLVAVWGRIARMRTRLERLVTLWQAGTLPAPRPSRAGQTRAPSVRTPSIIPTIPAWLLVAVREAWTVRTHLENLLSDAECAEFLAAVPQAARINRPLCRMLGIGETPPAPGRKPRAVWQAPKPAKVMVGQGGLVLGPGGRLVWG